MLEIRVSLWCEGSTRTFVDETHQHGGCDGVERRKEGKTATTVSRHRYHIVITYLLPFEAMNVSNPPSACKDALPSPSARQLETSQSQSHFANTYLPYHHAHSHAFPTE